MLRQPADLAKFIDHTLLKPGVTPEDIQRLCREAGEYSFKTVCVSPLYVDLAARSLKGSPVLVCTVVGFPLGQNALEVKRLEAQRAVMDGAAELDLVLHLGALRCGDYDYVKKEIKGILSACSGATLKVILETGVLNPETMVRGCRLVLEAGGSWIKTSTGFGPRGASVEDVVLLKKAVGDKGHIKASGGIRDFQTASEMIKAGASRIGTSHGIAIMQEFIKTSSPISNSMK